MGDVNGSRLSSDKHTVWSLDPHTRAKHDLLRGYLAAWFPTLGSWQGRVVFLDGFAGPGVYAAGEPGSPAIALNTLLDHSYFRQMPTTEFVFVFNEVDVKRHESLRQVVSGIESARQPWPSNVKVEVSHEGFQTLARNILDGLGPNKMAPTFAFLDPFGYKDVPMSLIAELAKYAQSELFLYFDFNSANRFGTAGVVDEHFEALFGTDEFKSAPPAQDPRRKVFIRDLYKRQLEQVAGFEFVRYFEMVNARGLTGHYLFFCTRHKTGLSKMKEVMWKVDPMGGSRFTDMLAGLEVLFTPEVDTAPLASALRKQFAGKTVSIEAIEDFVIVRTPYALSHLRRRTLKPMQDLRQIGSPNQKRRNTYPAGTLITFPA